MQIQSVEYKTQHKYKLERRTGGLKGKSKAYQEVLC